MGKAIFLFLGIIIVTSGGDLLNGFSVNYAQRFLLNGLSYRVSYEPQAICDISTTHLDAVQRAYEQFSVVYKLQQDSVAAAGLAEAVWSLGMEEHAIGLWEKASISNSDRHELWSFKLGIAYYCVDNVTQSARAFARTESGAEFPLMMGLRAQKRNDLNRALSWYQVAFLVCSDSVVAGRIVRIYEMQGQKDKILEVWQALAENNSVSSADHWWALGEAARYSGNWELAIQSYLNGLNYASGPDSFGFYQHLAWMYEKTGNFQSALQAHINSIEALPLSVWGYIGAGEMERKLGNAAAACGWFYAGAEVDPHKEIVVDRLQKLNCALR